VIERIKKFYDGTYDISKDKHLPRLLDPLKEEILQSIRNDKDYLNKIDLSYMKNRSETVSLANTNAKTTARSYNNSNLNKSKSPTNMNKSLLDYSLLERMHIEKSNDRNNDTYGNTQIMNKVQSKDTINENEEYIRKLSEHTFNSQSFNKNNNLFIDEYEKEDLTDQEGIDIGLFKDKMPMD